MKKTIFIFLSFSISLFTKTQVHAETPTPESIIEQKLSPEEQLQKFNQLSRTLCHQNLRASQALRAKVEKEELEMNSTLDEISRLRLGRTIATYAGPAVLFPSMAYATFRLNRLTKSMRNILIQNKEEIIKNNIRRGIDFKPVRDEFERGFQPLINLAIGNVAVVAISVASLDWIESAIKQRLVTLKELSEDFGQNAIQCATQQ